MVIIISQEKINTWKEHARKYGASHIIWMVCDSVENSDYPVYVMPKEDIDECIRICEKSGIERVVKVIEMELPETFEEHKADTSTIIGALRILANDIVSGDGVANLALLEAADRMEELDKQIVLNVSAIKENIEFWKHEKSIALSGSEVITASSYIDALETVLEAHGVEK